MKRIQSKLHRIGTYGVCKISLYDNGKKLYYFFLSSKVIEGARTISLF